MDEEQLPETKLAIDHLDCFSKEYTVPRCPLFADDKQSSYKLVVLTAVQHNSGNVVCTLEDRSKVSGARASIRKLLFVFWEFCFVLE